MTYTSNCKICLQTYKYTNTYNCSHCHRSFCINCYLTESIKSIINELLGFNCPCCKKLTHYTIQDIEIFCFSIIYKITYFYNNNILNDSQASLLEEQLQKNIEILVCNDIEERFVDYDNESEYSNSESDSYDDLCEEYEYANYRH